MIRYLLTLLLALLLIQGTALAQPRDLQVSFSFIPTLDCTTAGFRLYNESGVKVCESTDPDTLSITCSDVEVETTQAVFTMSSFCEDGRESPRSEPFTANFPEDLTAVIQANPSNGEAPLNVALDGSGSTGAIVSYLWSFGDGSQSLSGESVSHVFAAAATYTVTLTVTDNTGATASAQQQITVSAGTTGNTPPVPVIAASSSVGPAPLSVTFDGSGSSDAEGDTLTYTWSFGDGGSASGSASSTSHTYLVAGTYQATLTVSDGTASATTEPVPVLVSQEPGGGEQPTAVITCDKTTGAAPLAVTLDGSGSTPSSQDGSIVQYSWNFGDGESGTGQTVSHTFSVTGEYTVTLTVTDSAGKTSQASTAISATEEEAQAKNLIMIYQLLLLKQQDQ